MSHLGVGKTSPWGFLCATVQSRHLAKSDKTFQTKSDSKETLISLIEETTQILSCLQKLIESCCLVVFNSDSSICDDSSIRLSGELSQALWNKNSVELFVQSEVILDKRILPERNVMDRSRMRSSKINVQVDGEHFL